MGKGYRLKAMRSSGEVAPAEVEVVVDAAEDFVQLTQSMG